MTRHPITNPAPDPLRDYAEHQADPRNKRMDMVEWMERAERETEQS